MYLRPHLRWTRTISTRGEQHVTFIPRVRTIPDNVFLWRTPLLATLNINATHTTALQMSAINIPKQDCAQCAPLWSGLALGVFLLFCLCLFRIVLAWRIAPFDETFDDPSRRLAPRPAGTMPSLRCGSLAMRCVALRYGFPWR